MEIGPYRVGKGGKLHYNDGSWDEFANVLFVDNPVGTGFSYVDTDSYVKELDDMADQFMAFLEKFYQLFPEYMHDDASSRQSFIESELLTKSRFTSQVNHMPASISHTLRTTSSNETRTLRRNLGT